MRSNENYLPQVATAAFLTVAILISFQIFILREPARIAADEAYHKNTAVVAGKELFAKNCNTCHGDNGEGTDDGPSLNNKQFLGTIDDGTIFSIVSSGVPNTRMPSWNQSHGGPFTDEDVRNVVAFVRSWQPTAPELVVTVKPGDASRGQAIFDGTCFICHGNNGIGTTRAPALNDLDKLHQFDDAWYRDTIMNGRPAQGMPTWGTVLSPEQVNDIIALIDQWRSASPESKPTVVPTTTVMPATPVPTSTITTTSATTATTATTTTIAAVEPARPSNEGGPGVAITLKGNSVTGQKIYAQQCAKCHGEAGKGGVDNPGSSDGTIPALNPIDETLVNKDIYLYIYNIDLFIEHGSTPGG
ncbi:MAG TPA: c-type cytochrome, partial [Anaerolineae bacterium]